MKKRVLSIILLAIVAIVFCVSSIGCDTSGSTADNRTTIKNANRLQSNQATPTDIDYSLERYNLIRRAYWVNGMREKAVTLPCEVEKPLGYIVLVSGDVILASFIVDGKVSSLNSYLTPDTINPGSTACEWLADVDGSYGENDSGIFFFTPDGKYIEWTGKYLYSDIPFVIKDPVVTIREGE